MSRVFLYFFFCFLDFIVTRVSVLVVIRVYHYLFYLRIRGVRSYISADRDCKNERQYGSERHENEEQKYVYTDGEDHSDKTEDISLHSRKREYESVFEELERAELERYEHEIDINSHHRVYRYEEYRRYIHEIEYSVSRIRGVELQIIVHQRDYRRVYHADDKRLHRAFLDRSEKVAPYENGLALLQVAQRVRHSGVCVAEREQRQRGYAVENYRHDGDLRRGAVLNSVNTVKRHSERVYLSVYDKAVNH